jgi:hypothetical protein
VVLDDDCGGVVHQHHHRRRPARAGEPAHEVARVAQAEVGGEQPRSAEGGDGLGRELPVGVDLARAGGNNVVDHALQRVRVVRQGCAP